MCAAAGSGACAHRSKENGMKKEIVDTPRLIARWLFRIGIIWAVILVIPTIGFLVTNPVWGFLGYYWLTGFMVWLGWWWRSRGQRKLGPSVALWVFSLIHHLAFVVGMVAMLILTEDRWLQALYQAFVTDDMAFYSWYWIALSVVSVTALVAELKTCKRRLESGPGE